MSHARSLPPARCAVHRSFRPVWPNLLSSLRATQTRPHTRYRPRAECLTQDCRPPLAVPSPVQGLGCGRARLPGAAHYRRTVPAACVGLCGGYLSQDGQAAGPAHPNRDSRCQLRAHGRLQRRAELPAHAGVAGVYLRPSPRGVRQAAGAAAVVLSGSAHGRPALAHGQRRGYGAGRADQRDGEHSGERAAAGRRRVHLHPPAADSRHGVRYADARRRDCALLLQPPHQGRVPPHPAGPRRGDRQAAGQPVGHLRHQGLRPRGPRGIGVRGRRAHLLRGDHGRRGRALGVLPVRALHCVHGSDHHAGARGVAGVDRAVHNRRAGDLSWIRPLLLRTRRRSDGRQRSGAEGLGRGGAHLRGARPCSRCARPSGREGTAARAGGGGVPGRFVQLSQGAAHPHGHQPEGVGGADGGAVRAERRGEDDADEPDRALLRRDRRRGAD